MTPPRFFFADKPAGVTTHTSLNPSEKKGPLSPHADGFVEHLEARGAGRLFVVHRLDKETTGAICFARDSESAALLEKLFSGREVQKRYFFLTDRSVARDSYVIESLIERRGSSFVSRSPREGESNNARTEIRLLRREGRFALWEAKPSTGKPHQIRLHAESVGLPLLGDDLHGGSPFPALCLHSAELKFTFEDQEICHTTPSPMWFDDLSLLEEPRVCAWLAALDRRARLVRSLADLKTGFQLRTESTLRLIHSEGDPLRVEKLGPVHWLQWFEDQTPTEKEWTAIHRLLALQGWEKWYLQVRGNRGRAPNEETLVPGPIEFPQRWESHEGTTKFEFRTDSGLSPGLFLDQRRNREWVLENSRDRRVLNLFCYTGGFSVCAARGGATQVVSVDVSKTFLEWAKRNFELNGLSLEGHEFRAIDSREYLAWAKKKGLRFDLVICDPPSFGRSKLGVFRIDKDFDSLLEALVDVTAPGGRILFSSNYEAWSTEKFAARVLEWSTKTKRRLRLAPTPAPDWDFELPRQPKNMKSFFIDPTT